MHKTMMLALLLAYGTVRAADATEAENFTRDYNAARHYAYKYFLSYQEKYGHAMRVQQILKACSLEELATQIDRDLPKVVLYASDHLRADPNATPSDLSRPEMVLAVALATQSLIEGYELGFLEAEKVDAKSLGAAYCASAGKTYDEYLKGKPK
jgi:hypothetical protein